MQDGTFKRRKGRNETGHNFTSTFISHSDKHVFTIIQKQCTYKVKAKKHNAELQPNKKRQLLTVHLFRFTYKTGATHTFTQKAKKVKATLIGKEADRSVDQMHVEPG